ncbi:putative beta-hexosaminidase [Paraphoma chrysanthemicola]|uniref:beta-N-acetylhexosaminidase n=1 Tax=Paraphoma chrysanthemicola TaxID=798071 RepID=A0A8K0W087_9PLEO|nr:putative beta-hexosaminidase [Paraphoma chrysanthemicola]
MDSDLYPHRGFMLDTGRKFFPVQVILSLLTVLQQYNFNVFHWHIYDAETFPMYFPADGGLTNASIEHSYTSTYYTAQDIQSVISHAQDLGILVYPETDMPGHCDIWGIWKQYLTVGTPDLKNPHAQLDIRQPQTFDYITSLVSTVNGDFKSPKYHHFGADEVAYMWHTKDDNKLFQSFLDWLKSLQGNNNKTLLLWDDPLTDPEKHITLSKDWIIQTWHDGVTQAVLNKGHRVIVSENAAFYIDNADYNKTSSFVFPNHQNVLGFEVVWFTSEEDDPYDFNRSRVLEPLKAASEIRRPPNSSTSSATAIPQQASKAILKSFVAACLLVFLSSLFAT